MTIYFSVCESVSQKAIAQYSNSRTHEIINRPSNFDSAYSRSGLHTIYRDVFNLFGMPQVKVGFISLQKI